MANGINNAPQPNTDAGESTAKEKGMRPTYKISIILYNWLRENRERLHKERPPWGEAARQAMEHLKKHPRVMLAEDAPPLSGNTLRRIAKTEAGLAWHPYVAGRGGNALAVRVGRLEKAVQALCWEINLNHEFVLPREED